MRRTADEIDYDLIGNDLQAVIVTLDPGETVIAEAGAMMFMEVGIEMNTCSIPTSRGAA
jgi:uncharacterized protein (AIM24 family)